MRGSIKRFRMRGAACQRRNTNRLDPFERALAVVEEPGSVLLPLENNSSLLRGGDTIPVSN